MEPLTDMTRAILVRKGKRATIPDSLMKDVSFLFDSMVACHLVSSFPFTVPPRVALDELKEPEV
jgi:hypothetical protein